MAPATGAKTGNRKDKPVVIPQPTLRTLPKFFSWGAPELKSVVLKLAESLIAIVLIKCEHVAGNPVLKTANTDHSDA